MSMNDNLTVQAMNAAQKSMWQSQAEVNVNVGNGAMMASLSGANIDVTKGCGDSNMTLFSMGTLNVDTGMCGKDTINAVSLGDANIFTHGSDDHVELQTNGTFNVNVGNGSEPDNDYLKIIGTKSDALNKAALGNGVDTAIIIASNVQVDKGTGSMVLGSIGNNYTINTAASTTQIGAFGNNVKTNLMSDTASVDDIRSLDYWIEDGYNGKHILKDASIVEGKTELTADDIVNLKDVTTVLDKDGETKMSLTEYDAKYNSSTVDLFKSELGDMLYSMTNIGNYEVKREFKEIKQTDNRADIAKAYGLDEKNTEILMNLTDAQLKQTTSDGAPVYAIAKSVKTKNPDGSDRYVVVRRDGVNHSRSVESEECIAFYKTASTTTSTEVIDQVTQYDTVTSFGNASLLGNLSGWSVSDNGKNNTGSLNFIASVATGEFSVSKDADKTGTGSGTVYNIGNYVGGHISADSIVKTIDSKKLSDLGVKINMLVSSANTWTSPLVLDMNGDGVVSAAAGFGVDVNNDGKADGAATNGDKMLAMSDLNGNKSIDGAEVFGDQTVSPFTGKKLNAANGFEALKMIAQEAEQYTGIKCMDNDNVDVKKLAEALATKGIKLGFISDENNKELEDLAGVKSINVGSYKEVDASGDVQHRQLGSFIDENGKEQKVNDVWFKS